MATCCRRSDSQSVYNVFRLGSVRRGRIVCKYRVGRAFIAKITSVRILKAAQANASIATTAAPGERSDLTESPIEDRRGKKPSD